MTLDWDNKPLWWGLMALLLAAGTTLSCLNRVPVESAAAGDLELPREGFTAPDLTLQTLDGETVTLSDLRGQAVLINFWASWCPPCRNEMPAIQQVYEEYRDEGFTVVAVNSQEQETRVVAFAEPLGLTFPILIDRDGSVFDRYQVAALPTTFFVDRAGVIRGVTTGGFLSRAFFESEIAPLLAQEESE
jgi:cytochrome c biogenesis protein CcmG/thiol:disulfide interchange protein DsbE